jgi:hypothetical protein
VDGLPVIPEVTEKVFCFDIFGNAEPAEGFVLGADDVDYNPDFFSVDILKRFGIVPDSRCRNFRKRENLRMDSPVATF